MFGRNRRPGRPTRADTEAARREASIVNAMVNPIFIVGANRSGTTLFRLMLNKHSQIAVPDELSYFHGPFFWRGRRSWATDRIPRSRYDGFVSSFLRRTANVLAPLDADKLQHEILEREGTDLRFPYDFVLTSWARAHGKSRWGEKTPGNLFHVSTIVRMFPDALFVYMVRDPRAGATSMQQSSIYSEDLVINALNRRRYMSDGYSLLEKHVSPDNRHVLRYEDLVADPESSLRGTLSFLGLEFEPAMLTFHENAREFMGNRASSELNVAATGPVDRSKIDSWRGVLSQREIAVVESICGEEMDRFGYVRDGTPVRARDFAAILTRLCYWRLQMWKHRHIPQYQVQHGLFPRLHSVTAPLLALQ